MEEDELAEKVQAVLDEMPRSDQYRAALIAVDEALPAWKAWSASLTDSRIPKDIRDAPDLARQGVERWLRGDGDAGRLRRLLDACERAWRLAGFRDQPDADYAAVACSAAMYLVAAALGDATGNHRWRGDPIDTGDAVVATAMLMDVAFPTPTPYLIRWLEHLDEKFSN